jgi:hypothetical protein
MAQESLYRELWTIQNQVDTWRIEKKDTQREGME